MESVNQTPNDKPSSSEIQINRSSRKMNYSAAIQRDQFPKKDQGLILDCSGDLTLTDYTVAIGELVQPKNILFASRISNNRVCLYLSKKELVCDIAEKYKYVSIGNEEVTVRPLIVKQHRVILSNVAPPIPHSVLEEAIDELNIKRLAPISFLRATISHEGYSHVLSSRRQTYLNPDDVEKLPEYFKIIFEDTPYYIYPSTGTVKCFYCKTEGHIAKHCPQLEPESNSQNQPSLKISNKVTETRSNQLTIGEQSFVTATTNANNDIQIQNDCINDTSKSRLNSNITNLMPGFKRPPASSLSSGSSTSYVDSQQNQLKIKTPKDSVKKIKMDNDEPKSITLENINQHIDHVKNFIEENSDKFPISYEQTAAFLLASYKHQNIPQLALTFTQDLASLNLMRIELHSKIEDRKLKNRINRLIKRLKSPLTESTDEEDSQSKEE